MDDLAPTRATRSQTLRMSPTAGAVGRRVALIGNFPPRRCGIATFSEDLRSALMQFGDVSRCDVYAMTEAGVEYDYPPSVAMGLNQQDPAAYLDAARRINASGVDTVSLQHEYGIFGGPAGSMVLTLLDALRAPIVTTLHTVLERPDPDQRRVLQQIIAVSARLVVMAEKGRDILRRVYDAPASKIIVTPHGAPDMPSEPTDRFKRMFDWESRRVILTFGLLSPNKGIQHMLAAMPAIVARHPDALYVVLGATHPHLKAQEGESYRERLMVQVETLGVADNVVFIDDFADNDRLLDYLRACDIYVTPYLHEAQITSGTLACAVALGRAIVSTPYWHAKEVLADHRGVLCPFADSGALTRAIDGLLSDNAARETLSSRAYALGRDTTWEKVAHRYADTFLQSDRAKAVRAPASLPTRLPSVNLAGVERLTDDRGIMQHTVFGIADRAHGYCLDDAARALILMNDACASGDTSGTVTRLANGYAAFVQHAWNDGAGSFRNFMSFGGHWLEERGSGDSFGRAVWALGVTAQRGATPALRRWATALLKRVLPHVEQLEAPRSRALSALGLAALLRVDPGNADAASCLRVFAGDLDERFRAVHTPAWAWFEESLSYDNARLPEALIRSAMALGDAGMVRSGLTALRWLCTLQTAEEGWFRPVGSTGFGARFAKPDKFDQQPLEAAATIDACCAAFDATHDASWIHEARRAYAWYLGVNDLGLAVAIPEEGLCFDGLTPYDVNRNQGAESVLAFQSSTCALHALLRERGTTGALTRVS